MSAPVLTFFNNKGGVGKTSLIYHLAWMFADLGKKVVCADLDPQANLTAAFLNEDEIERLWEEDQGGSTIYQCIQPLTDVRDIASPALQKVGANLFLIPGDVRLSNYEDTLSSQWPDSMGDANLFRPMRILSSFWLVMQMAAQQIHADVILADIGPNLGAINRSVLIATDYVAIPLGADLFSLQGLKNLGPTLKSWKKLWEKRLDNWEENSDSRRFSGTTWPRGQMLPIGYLCQQHGVRLDRPVRAYDKWVQRIPNVYREYVLNIHPEETISQQDDPYCLATIKHYRSLVPMARECRKPIFHLTASDGAIGSHANAVRDARQDFGELAQKIGEKIGVPV